MDRHTSSEEQKETDLSSHVRGEYILDESNSNHIFIETPTGQIYVARTLTSRLGINPIHSTTGGEGTMILYLNNRGTAIQEAITRLQLNVSICQPSIGPILVTETTSTGSFRRKWDIHKKSYDFIHAMTSERAFNPRNLYQVNRILNTETIKELNKTSVKKAVGLWMKSYGHDRVTGAFMREFGRQLPSRVQFVINSVNALILSIRDLYEEFETPENIGEAWNQLSPRDYPTYGSVEFMERANH